MDLRLYNTLTRTKDVFRPLDPSRVRMYVCGPTVYDFAHIGNARPLIVFDVLFRLLRHLYGPERVTYVRNITDVDDKINARAAERGISIRELTEQTYQNFSQDVAALGCLPPTVEPRATDHIEQMKALIERLVAGGHAYVAEQNVLFSVPSMPDYGRLSRRPLDEMIAGARVDVAPYKRDPQDFVLWKPSRGAEPAWPSPCGIATAGRPGWHIECSAMAWKHLGETFDIHGGGIDLVFPHHENEIAQTRCAFHAPVMAQVWMHNGFLQVEGEKMAKSSGNFVTIRELLTSDTFGERSWDGHVLRMAMLRTHYRQPIDWTLSGLEEAARTIRSWANLLERHATSFASDDPPPSQIASALLDDINTPMAIGEMHKLAEAARGGDFDSAQGLHQAGKFLGIFSHSLMSWKDFAAVGEVAAQLLPEEFQAQVKAKLADRHAAREAKNFAESDRIRDELAAMGVVLKDSKDGTTWELAR
jgi:cysteinyl-tRNA synthetase